MVLEDMLVAMGNNQEIVVFQGFNVKYIGKKQECLDEKLRQATVKSLESNGKNITIKLI